MCVRQHAPMSLSKDNSSRRVVLVLLTSYFFILLLLVLLLVFFIIGKGKIPIQMSPEWPIPFSFQSLNFCIAITFVTVKQTKKQAKTKGTAYRNCLASQKGANHCFSQPDCNAWIVWKHNQGPIATSFFSSGFTISRFSKLVLIYIYYFFY